LVTLLLSVGRQNSRLHFKTSNFNQQFFLKYKIVLSARFEAIYYRFSDAQYFLDGRQFRDGHITKFLQEAIPNISKIITDNQHIIDEDKKILGQAFEGKYFKINSIIEINEGKSWKSHEPNYRILWASRFAFEKRPEVLIEIIKLLRGKIPQSEIDIYGKNMIPELVEQMTHVDGLNYRGEFSNFYDLPIDNYDLLLYTSRFEGASIIVLEAMCAGLPVIGPKVGGVPESISDPKYLVEDNSDNLELAISYVELLLKIYPKFHNVIDKFEILSAETKEKHSKNRHMESVATVFRLENESI
jgi:glycosyltransferase involved in cell wall biosynthesis